MARTLRVEYEGARYHVMCRGNQSRDIFTAQEDADLFVRCLGEMCVRNGAAVHAWCLMSNHYHLLLETPLGNLVDGMKWLQGTFTRGLEPSGLSKLAKSDPRKLLIAGLLRYHYPVRVQWVSEQLVMGHFTRVSRAMKFYDEAEGAWAKEKRKILKFIG